MKPTDTTHTPDGILPTPGSYPLYEYPAYTFDRKYENDEFQKKVIISPGSGSSGMRQDGYPCRKGGSCPLMRCVAG